MKNLNRFYVFYGIVLAISIVVLLLEVFNYNSQLNQLFETVAYLGLLFLMPLGALQVIFALATYLATRDKQWMFYFIPFLIWIIAALFVWLKRVDIDFTNFLYSPLYILPVICYITYIVLIDKSLKGTIQSSKR